MQCPECDISMNPVAVGDDIIKECHQCKGLWFDSGQLEEVKNEVLPDMKWLDIEELKDQSDFQAQLDIKFCPVCRDAALVKIHDIKTGAEFCTCKECQGTWLGTGQFLFLINLLLDEVKKISAPELMQISLRQVRDMLLDSDSNISEWRELRPVLELIKHRIFVENPKLRSVVMGIQKSLPL